MTDSDGRDQGPSSQIAEVARFAGHGLTLALAVLLFFLAGFWVDGLLGTRPLFAIVGAMLGAFGGFYSMYQHLVLKGSEGTKKEDRDGPGEGGRA